MLVRRSAGSFSKVKAAAVHILTATGSVCGLLALLAASHDEWRGALAWLGVALIVDAVDGPLARLAEVERTLPRFSGKDLDNVVDYLTYVTVPAFIVARADVAPSGLKLALAGLIMMVSLYHFADTESKTHDGYFVGFPAIWNVIVLYIFVLAIPPGLSAALITICAVLTFVPLRWVHPVRVRRLRGVTATVVVLWAIAALSVITNGFPGTAYVKIVFAVAALYVFSLAAGLAAKSR